jgi:dolichyl-phosphate beta-glucosyltransferase
MANLQKGVLDRVIRFLKKKNYVFEVIVSDDGSKDGSIAFVEKFIKENPQVHLLKNKHLGKAGAVTKGVLAAKGKYIIFLDMDQATPIEELDALFPYVADKGYDIAIGSRTHGNMGYPFSRRVLHDGMIYVRKIIVGMYDIYDTQCGFKLFTRDSAHTLFSKLDTLHNGFSSISGSAVKAGFDVELLFLAKKMHYKIKEVPVHWLFVETRRVNGVKDAIDAIIYLLQIRYNQIKGKYN